MSPLYSSLATSEDDQRLRASRQRKAVQADLRNKLNFATADPDDIAKGREFEELARDAYFRRSHDVYLNCNEKTITIKVKQPTAADKIDAFQHKEFQSFVAANCSEIKTTKTSTIYHIPRKDKS